MKYLDEIIGGLIYSYEHETFPGGEICRQGAWYLEEFQRREKILTDALREIMQPCGMNYAGDSWEYTPKNYRDMAYKALQDIMPKINQTLR